MAEPWPTSFRAELRAALETLPLASPPLTIHTDNQQLVDGWVNGEKWCCSSRRDGADMWRELWARIKDIGPGIRIVKVKAHLSFIHVQRGTISQQDWCGNGLADAWAKAGCAIASKEAPVATVHSRWAKTMAWYRWVTRFATEWGGNDICGIAPPTAPSPPPLPKEWHPSHEVWRNQGTAWCRACGA